MVKQKLFVLVLIQWFVQINFLISQGLAWQGNAFKGPVFSLSVKDSVLFVGMGSRFTVYDIRQPSIPMELGYCHTTDCITYISCIDTTCYVGNNGMGIAEINIVNLSAPYVKRYLYPNQVAGYNPVIEGNIGFFPFGSAGLWAFRLGTNDSLPFSQWGSLPGIHDFCIDVVKKDSFLYVTDRSGGIFLLKFVNDQLVQHTHWASSTYWAMECELDEQKNYLYVTGFRVNSLVPTTDTLSLWVFDLQHPDNFNLVGVYKHPPVVSYPLDLKIKNGYAYIACWNHGIIVVDVSDPQHMFYVGSLPTDDASNWVEVVDTAAWVADLSAGFKQVSLTNLANPLVIFKNDTVGDTFGVAKYGQFVYTTIKDKGLGIAQTTPQGIIEKNFISIRGRLYAPFIRGNLLYLPAWDKGVLVYDLTNPLSPDSITSIKRAGNNGAIAVHVYNNQMVVAEATYQFGLWRNCYLYVWDISNLSSPILLGEKHFLTLSIPYDLPLYSLDRHENLVMLSQWHDVLAGNLWLFDVTNPQQILLKDSIAGLYSSDAKMFTRSGKLYAAVAIGSAFPGIVNGLKIYEITSSNTLEEKGFFYVGNKGNRLSGLDVFDSRFVVSAEGGIDSKGMLRLISVEDPLNLVLLDTLHIGSNTSHNDILIDGNFIYHAAGSPGLMQVHRQWGLQNNEFYNSTMDITFYPNPATQNVFLWFEPTSSKSFRIDIINYLGQIQFTMHETRCSPCEFDVSQFKPGLYFFRLLADNGVMKTIKMLVLH